MFYLAFENEMETWPILKNNLDTFYTFLLHIFGIKAKTLSSHFIVVKNAFGFT